MAVNLADVLRELSPEDRDEVECGARHLIVESRTLRALRKALGVTQDQLADALETTQGNVAQIEGKRDVMVSTVTRIVNALGGDLHLIATFPGHSNPVRIWIGDGESVLAKRLPVNRRSGVPAAEPSHEAVPSEGTRRDHRNPRATSAAGGEVRPTRRRQA